MTGTRRKYSLRPSPRGVAALIVLALSAAYLLEARTYRFGNASNPGAGMFPVATGIALLLTAAVVLISEYSGRASEAGNGSAAHPAVAGEPRRRPTSRLLPFALTVALYPLAIRAIGFEVATALALPAMALAMGERRTLRLLLLVAGGVAATYAIFRMWLAVPLP